MSGQKICMEMRLEDPLNGQTVRLGIGNVLGNVSLGVNDDSATGCRVADEVGRVRETSEVVLTKKHHGEPSCPATLEVTQGMYGHCQNYAMV